MPLVDDGWSFGFEKNPLYKLKVRLQWTGWLQYMPPFTIALSLWLFSHVERRLLRGGAPAASSLLLLLRPLASVFGCIGILDLLLVKFDWGFSLVPEPLRFPPKRRDDWTPIELMKARHSCRSFQKRRKLTQEHRREFLDKVQQSLRKPLLADDNDYKNDDGKTSTAGAPIRLEYISEPLRVWPAVNAHEFIVAIAPKEYSKMAVMNVGYVLEKAVVHAFRMGLGTCWIGPGADHDAITAQLGPERFDAEKDHVICVCAIGYASWFMPLMLRAVSLIASKQRKPLQELFSVSTQSPINTNDDSNCDDPVMKQVMEACRWSPSSFNAQTTRAVFIAAGPEKKQEEQKTGTTASARKLQRVDFYRTKDSKYYAPVALGIWLARWELACQQMGIGGSFRVIATDKNGKDNGKQDENEEEHKEAQPPLYDISWVFDRDPPPKTRGDDDGDPLAAKLSKKES